MNAWINILTEDVETSRQFSFITILLQCTIRKLGDFSTCDFVEIFVFLTTWKFTGNQFLSGDEIFWFLFGSSCTRQCEKGIVTKN